MTLLDNTLKLIAPMNAPLCQAARARLETLTMPHWALGRLMDLAVELAGMTESLAPPLERKVVVTMAADHGVAEEDVSQYPQDVTTQMVRNFVRGGAGINALAGQAGARVVVVDMGVKGDLGDLVAHGAVLSKRIGPGTQNFARGPAMERDEALASIEAGIEIALSLAEEVDLLGTGDMGIGNTSASAAIATVLTGKSVADVTGRGTGIDDQRLLHKRAVIERGLMANHCHADDPIDVLAKVGGFEIGGIAGLILGAAALRKPVLIDGFISGAGALIAQALSAHSMDYCIASHRSAERGHALMLDHLGKRPLLDLDLRLGEGTGAALAMPLVGAAKAILTEIATFAEAQVSEKVS